MTSPFIVFAVVASALGQVDAKPSGSASFLPPPEQAEAVERELRGFHEYSDQLQAWFKQEATAENNAEQVEAIVALCALYHELRTDPRYGTSDALKQMKIKIWSRLSRVKKSLKAEAKRRGDPISKPTAPSSSPSTASANGADLLQRLEAESSEARGGGARRGDHGRDLVELIERTIAPTKWDVNGGPFTIVYYAPLHALVVRASSDVHGRLGGLLGGLRRAGN